MHNSLFICWIGLIVFFLAACEATGGSEQTILKNSAHLEGRWNYDSTGLDCYSADLKYQGGSTEPVRAGAVLTIGPNSWVYSGSLHETHDYTCNGQKLILRRIGDTRMVRNGYIVPESVGQAIGRPSQHDIVLLTSTRLIVRDSVNAVSSNCGPGRCFCVVRFYYSR